MTQLQQVKSSEIPFAILLYIVSHVLIQLNFLETYDLLI